MKVRQLTVCQSCRSRKLGCDGKRPSCSQCLARNRVCPGYPTNLIFLPPQSAANLQPKGRRAHPRAKTRARITPAALSRSINSPSYPARETASPAAICRPLTWPICDIVSLCALNFVPASELPRVSSSTRTSLSRICGAWVGVLPSLVGTSDACFLYPAIKALGLSIVARGPCGRAPVADALEARHSALRVLSRTIHLVPDSSFNALAASMMCLFMSEALLPTNPTGPAVHAEGIIGLLQRHPPAFYATGPAHTLFAGFQPILVLHSLTNRTSSFLASDSWKADPFGTIPMTPLQVLMTEASEIPAVLEKLDVCTSMKPEKAVSLAHGAVETMVEVVNKLMRTLRCAAISGSHWWCVPRGATGEVTGDEDGEGGESVWFPDITTANYLTYFWAFWIMCVSQIRRLRGAYPCLLSTDVWLDGQAPESTEITGHLVELSLRIMQSMEFLMQDEMKLFGVSSAVLPFQTALSFLREHGDGRGCSGTVAKVLERINRRGYGDILVNNPSTTSTFI